ncbi:1-acyl-sn-glycerol-3-phosphate acyltransferase [Streptomyces sp. QHH-9511]|uniref:lysophospholipid acyltransferase family protein n=1 Tax=Streptomyces sp. QHH-9511 TaxID=2684468 RepID=UPI001317FB72|nr:lysophospholipid acyltransferase family protein [Streptomyces sp. QHH-9511]QGZ52037.1 1-acyl-sn-glycerol-3-phosphate acyltransferase [Streptomyces sp. QHH-9511]
MNRARTVSPWLPTAPCTPGRCAPHPGPGSATVRPLLAVVRLVTGLGVVLTGLLLALLAVPLPAAARRSLVRHWCRAVIRAFGVRLRITGAAPAAPTGPLLVVANHISWLDIPLVAAVLPGRMLAKREVRAWPVLGALAALGGTLFIDRDRLRTLPELVRTMTQALAAGGRVIVFPEGSTWCGRAGGAFRPAAFQAALDASAAVQPVRLEYRPTGPAAFVGDDPLGASLWRIAAAGGLTAEIRILDPISIVQYPDRRSLARAAQYAVTGDSASKVRAIQAVQRAVASDSANRPSSSVHQWDNSSPAAVSSSRTPA